MGNEYFSSHLVHYLDEDGVEQDIKIDFEFSPVENQDVGEGEVYSLHKVIASFEFLGESHDVRAYGDNRAQAVLRAMGLIGIVVLGVAEEHGIGVYKYEPGDASEALDLFS